MSDKARLTNKQKMFLLDRFYDSGLSQKTFCENENMAASSLSHWVQKDRELWRPSSKNRKAEVIGLEEPGAGPAKLSRPTYEGLEDMLQDTRAKLVEAYAKIDVLQHVIITLGGQTMKHGEPK